MCTDDRGHIKIIKRPQLHFVLEAKRHLDLVRENEEKFRSCPSEKNMDKLLDDLPPFTYNTIVKYVRNAGKNIQRSASSRRIFTSHSRNISRIEKCQKSETIGLMKDNLESSTFSLTASDGRQRYAIFFPSDPTR